MCSLLGFDATALFFRRALDRIGVVPSVFRREEFKAAASPLVNDKYDPYHRWGGWGGGGPRAPLSPCPLLSFWWNGPRAPPALWRRRGFVGVEFLRARS
jgi:hypothetical protein